MSISNHRVLQPPQTNAAAPTNSSATAGIAWLSFTAVAVGRSVSTVPKVGGHYDSGGGGSSSSVSKG